MKRTTDEHLGASKRMALEAVDSSSTKQQEENFVIDAEFIEKYQKEAIWREMNVYKERLTRADDKLNSFTKEYADLELKSAILSRWLNKVNEAFRLMDGEASDSPGNSTLITLGEEGDAIIEKILADTNRRVNRLISGISAKSSGEVEKDKEELSVKILELSDKCQVSEQLMKACQSQLRVLEKRNEDLEQALIHDLRRTERERSKYGKITEQTQPSTVSLDVNVSRPGNHFEEELAQSSDALETDISRLKAELDDLRDQHAIASELAENRGNQLSSVLKQLTETRQNLDQAKINIDTLPDSIILETGVCRQLKRQAEFFQAEVQQLREQLDRTVEELKESKSERQKLREQLEGEYDDRMKTLESELHKMSGDLNRIRATRDQLQQQLELEKAKRKEHDNINQDLILNAKANKDRVLCLLEEIKRIKTRLAAFSGDRELFQDILISCELSEEQAASPNAVEEHKTLLKSYKDRLIEVETSMRLLQDRLKVKEQSSDPNNATESFDDLESLKCELNTAQDRIKQYESIFGALDNYSNDEQQSTMVDKIRGQGREIESLNLKIRHFELAEKSTVNEIEMISQSFTNLEARQTQQAKLLIDKDDQIAKLLSERIKHDQKLIAMQKEKDSHANKAIALSRQAQKQQDMIRKLEEDVAAKDSALLALEKEIAQFKFLVTAHERKAQDALELAEELALKIEKTGSKFNEISMLVRDRDAEVGEYRQRVQISDEENRKLQQKVKLLTKKLQCASNTSSGGDVGDELEALRDWKKIAQCSVCEFRIKNQVITRCMHVFCKECIDKRLDTRQRKCPQCGMMFGPGDVKQIFI